MSEDSTKPTKKTPKKVQDCIYEVGTDLYDVRVRLRFGGKQHSLQRRSIKFETNAVRVKKELEKILFKRQQAQENGDVDWERALAEYFEQREGQVAKKTYINQMQTVKKHTEEWKPISLSEFKREFIAQDLKKKLKNSPKSTIKSILKHIRAVFEYHLHKQKSPLEFNPCRGIKPWAFNDLSLST